jgi:hypothetical protein
MNYRHAFHAGNFADVFKHTILIGLLQALREKPAPFCAAAKRARPAKPRTASCACSATPRRRRCCAPTSTSSPH